MPGKRQARSDSASGAKDATTTRLFGTRLEARRRLLFIVLSCLVGTVGLTAGSREVFAVAAVSLLLGLVGTLGDLYLQKRRDDMYASVVRECNKETELLWFITLYEAVRTRQLASEDIVKLPRSSELQNTIAGSVLNDKSSRDLRGIQDAS